MNRKLSIIVGAAALLAVYGVALAQPGSPPAYGPPGVATVPYPGLAGAYSKSLTSGTIGAGIAANAPVYSFRYGGTGVAIVRTVCISVANAGTAFTAGNANLSLYAARAFTASDSAGTAGTLTGNNGKLRTSFSTTAVSSIQIANTGALTAGTRTLDTDPLSSVNIPVPATTTNYSLLSASCAPWGPAGDVAYPLLLATNEGFVIQTNMPATGTWTLQVRVDWEEAYSF